MVGAKRLELLHLAAPEPKSGASTNSATPPSGAHHSKQCLACLVMLRPNVQTLRKILQNGGLNGCLGLLLPFFIHYIVFAQHIHGVKQVQLYCAILAKVAIAVPFPILHIKLLAYPL